VLMELQQRGIYAVGLDNFNTYYDVTLKHQRANLSKAVVHGDVCNRILVSTLLHDHHITHVIHLSAQAGVRYSLEHPQEYVRNNVACFVDLLETLRGTSIPLIYASSSSVYGKNTKVPFAETDRVDQPVSLYAATKRENELLAHTYWNLHKQRSIGLRFFTVYGPMGRPDMAYYSFTKNIMEGRPIKVFNHGKLSRDFTYITDIVDGVVSCLGITYEHEILNLGRGEPQQLMGFIHSIERATGKDAVLEYVDMAKGDVLTTYADVTKARRLLGYNPKISLDEGIDKFVDWFRMIRKKSTS
jgi:UDP-glucuronate 4-epimerase